MGTETCQTKTLADCPWRNTGIYINEFWADAIIISPSTRFAMIRIFSFKKHNHSRIYVYDLFKGKINRILLEPEWKIFHEKDSMSYLQQPAYCYWLNDDLISIFDENAKKEKYVHYFYQINLDDPKSRLQLITKCDYSYQAMNRFGNSLSVPGNVCKITVNNHDFLFVRACDFVLVPYNLLAPGPHLPLLKMNMRYSWIRGGEYFADYNTAFAYRDKVYFELTKNDCFYDRFLQVDIDDFDLLARMATFTLDAENATVFIPRKLNEGSYIAEYGARMNLDGPWVLFYENRQSPTTMDPRKIWLLNLENGTILEKIIEKQPFTEATMYRGFLILWDMHKSTMKYHWINNHVPALSDICRVTVSAYNHQPQSWLRQCKRKTKQFVNRYRF